MTADTTRVMAHRKRKSRRFRDVDTNARQLVIDPTTHQTRQRLIFNSLTKDKALVPINKCPCIVDKPTEPVQNSHSLQWFSVLALLLFAGVFIYVVLQWSW